MYEVRHCTLLPGPMPVAFEDFSSNHPNTALAVKPLDRLSRYHPSHSPDYESAKQIEWNRRDKILRIGLDSVYTNVGAAMVEPPLQMIFLVESFLGNRVIDDGRRFVPKQLAAV